MKTGVILPSFAQTPDAAFEVAIEAEARGIDGVFCYDHIWPMGQPERPAIAPFPLLGAIARRTSTLYLGTLVARIGLVPTATLVSQFAALEALAPGRVIAGLGTGDRLSAAENESYGIPFDPPDVRREQLWQCADELARRGMPVWIGAGARQTEAVTENEAVALNLWDVGPARVVEAAGAGEVTWAGPDRSKEDPERKLSTFLPALAAAGATWAVLAWPVSLAALVEGAGGHTLRR